LSGRGLCDELITRPEESYRLWCVVVCDLENLKNEEAMTRVGSQRHKKKKSFHKPTINKFIGLTYAILVHIMQYTSVITNCWTTIPIGSAAFFI